MILEEIEMYVGSASQDRAAVQPRGLSDHGDGIRESGSLDAEKIQLAQVM